MGVVLDAVEVEVTLRCILGDLNKRNWRRAEGVGPDVLAREVARLQCVEARVGLCRSGNNSGCAVRLKRPVDDLEVLSPVAVADVLRAT